MYKSEYEGEFLSVTIIENQGRFYSNHDRLSAIIGSSKEDVIKWALGKYAR